MTKYIKTGTTEFEQFDLSKEMSDKYGVEHYRSGFDAGGTYTYGYRLQTLEGTLEVHLGDWIATGVNGEHWAVKDEIFQKTYKKLPVIPKVWGDTIEEFKANHYRLNEMLNEWDWNYDEQKLIARAWLDGYEVAEVEE